MKPLMKFIGEKICNLQPKIVKKENNEISE
jgi:hypothetical protein